MEDEKLGHNDSERFASTSFPTDDESQSASADTKGKQKAGLRLAASQLGVSTKRAMNAITTLRELPVLTSESKSYSGSSSLSSLSSSADECSSYKPLQNRLLHQSQKAKNDYQDGLFDTFTQSSTHALPNDGNRVDNFGSSIADQETSDGLAVLELLSRPVKESLETSLFRKNEHRTPGEDEIWNEAAARTLTDQEDQLDFTPDFIVRPELSEQAVPYLGTEHTEETGSTWLRYWRGVFTAYNARVWGNSYAVPTLEIPERGFQQGQDSGEPAVINQAIDRLKLIFYHLRG